MIDIEIAWSFQFLDSHHRCVHTKIQMQSIVRMMNVNLEQMQGIFIKTWNLRTKKHQKCFSS